MTRGDVESVKGRGGQQITKGKAVWEGQQLVEDKVVFLMAMARPCRNLEPQKETLEPTLMGDQHEAAGPTTHKGSQKQQLGHYIS